jgi:hypothetical protein
MGKVSAVAEKPWQQQEKRELRMGSSRVRYRIGREKWERLTESERKRCEFPGMPLWWQDEGEVMLSSPVAREMEPLVTARLAKVVDVSVVQALMYAHLVSVEYRDGQRLVMGMREEPASVTDAEVKGYPLALVSGGTVTPWLNVRHGHTLREVLSAPRLVHGVADEGKK